MADVQVRVQQIVQGGQNVAAVAKGIEQMGTAADRAAIRVAALKAQQQTLGQAVASGNMSLDDAAAKYSAFKQSLPTEALGKASGAAKQAGVDFAAMGRQVNEALSTVQKSAVALAAAGVTFKKAFEFGREGQALTQIETSFNRLNETVFRTPGLLEDMRAAAKGTIRDVDLMAATLTITAGTTGVMSEALARATPDLVAMAKAAAAINPAFGDATFLLDSLSVAAKRQSRLLADNAGIIVRMDSAIKEVHPSLSALADTYDDLPDELRFLNEMLFQGNNLLEQAGGSADSATDAYDRLTVQVQEATDAAKQWLGEGLLPVIQALNDDNNDAIGNIVQGNLEAVKSVQDIREEFEKYNTTLGMWFGLAAAVTGTESGLIEGLKLTAAAAANAVDNYDEYQEVLGALDGRALNVARSQGFLSESFFFLARNAAQARMSMEAFADIVNKMDLPTEEVESFAIALSEAKDADIAMLNSNSRAAEAWDRVAVGARSATEYVNGLGAAERELTFTTAAAVQRGKEQAEAFWEQREAAAALDKTIAGITSGALGGQLGVVDKLAIAYQDLEAAQGTYSTVAIDNSRQIGAVNAQLAGDLSDEQRDAWQDIIGTVEEGSAQYLQAYNALANDLSESQRQALVVERAELEAAQGGLARVYSGDIEAAADAQKRIDELNAEMRDSYGRMVVDIISATDGFDEVAANFAVATGVMSEEQAKLYLQTIQTTSSLEQIGRAIDEGTIGVDQGAQLFAGIVEGGGAAKGVIDELIQQAGSIGEAVSSGAITEEQGRQLVSGLLAGKEDVATLLEEMKGMLTGFATEISAPVFTGPDSGLGRFFKEEIEAHKQQQLGELQGAFEEFELTAQITFEDNREEHIAAIESAYAPLFEDFESGHSVIFEDNADEVVASVRGVTNPLFEELATSHPINFHYNITGTPPVIPRASGGPVSAGSTYLVGEVGPELFVPNVSGSIVPNSMLASASAGGGGGNNYTINIPIYGATDPERTADAVIQKLQDRAIVPRVAMR